MQKQHRAAFPGWDALLDRPGAEAPGRLEKDCGMMAPYEEYVMLSLARRFATGDTLVEKDIRESVRCLKEVLRKGSDDARFEAWKIVDSGMVGNRIAFLVLRFRDWVEKGRSMRRYGLPVVWPFGAEVTYHYAEALYWARICLFVAEGFAIVFLLKIKLF